jgi:lipopolysaccharide export system protein LptC
MKRSKSLILGLALLLATSAFAANKGSLQVQEPLTVNGTRLAPGEYKVQWDGAGPNVELSILDGKKVVAKVPAHMIDLDRPSTTDSAVVKNNGDGTRTLSEVRLNGKKFSLAVGEEAAKADATK